MNTVRQIPMSWLALGTAAMTFAGTGNATSVELRAEAESPTETSSSFTVDIETQSDLAWHSLASAVLAHSRPQEDWERKAADDFFWSHFK